MDEYMNCYSALVAELRKEITKQRERTLTLQNSINQRDAVIHDLKLQIRGMRPKLTL